MRNDFTNCLLWLVFPLITGVLLHVTMPDLGWMDHDKTAVLYGLLVFAITVIAAGMRTGFKNELLSPLLSVSVLLVAGFIVLLGTLVPVQQEPGLMSVYRSYYFNGVLGLLGALQFLAIRESIYSEIPYLKFIGKFAAHAGILLVLTGGAIGTAFSSQGIITLYEGGKSAVYSVTEGPYRTLTGEVKEIGENCRTKKIPKDPEDPSYKGYSVNCSPGFTVAALGMLLVVCGLAALTFQRSYSLLIPGIILASVLLWVLTKFTGVPPFLQSIWFVPHVTSYFTGYAFVVLAGISAFISMRAAQKFASGAFLFLTFGLCLGSIWANEAWGAWWSWDPKENLALTQWILLASFVHLPEQYRLSKWGAALLVFVLLLSGFMYLGMHVLPTAEASLHVYG